MEISKALAMARKAQKPVWSFAKVAALVGVTESTVRRWEAGKFQPNGDQLMILRRGLPKFAHFLDKGNGDKGNGNGAAA